ncbi:MAG: hypothetical protein Q9222_007016 [Ikaeria aurantiellina]
MSTIIRITNHRLIHNGKLYNDPPDLFINTSTGLIISDPLSKSDPSFQRFGDTTNIKTVNLHNTILAPAYLELQSNGALGKHFTHFDNEDEYWRSLERILPHLYPQSFFCGASLLGAHVEGPYLNPSKKGAHGIDAFDASLMLTPESCSLSSTYGPPSSTSNIKLLTLAPELPGSLPLIKSLTSANNIKVSLGHSGATYDTGLAALKAGATCLTHIFNAMNPLHHREPGLGGLIALIENNKKGEDGDEDEDNGQDEEGEEEEEKEKIKEEGNEEALHSPYFSLIADGVHVHPATVTLAFRANPTKCILITDAVEMAGLPDGLYPGHAQIPHQQRKEGNRVTIEGTETLIGGCSTIDECVRNLKRWSGCSLAEAVRCATENVARMMGVDGERGVIKEGRRADFVVLNDEGEVLGTWIAAEEVMGDFDSDVPSPYST